MGLYTRTGDRGQTGLLDGSRVPKDHARVAAYGAVDELNAHLGVAAAQARNNGADFKQQHERIVLIQNELFSIGADLATPDSAGDSKGISSLAREGVSRLESWIDEATSEVKPLKAFILPGGEELAARLHVCRTVCRRAERELVTLSAAHSVNAQILVYINRLSDLLFAWSRLANRLAGMEDVLWEQPKA